jgi:hypothetical protein
VRMYVYVEKKTNAPHTPHTPRTPLFVVSGWKSI